jgi:hypothetical protein
MIVVTGNCLSSGYEMLDPEIFKEEFQKLISLPEDEHFNTRLAKIYDLYLRADPRYKKMNEKSVSVRNILAQKKIRELENEVSWPVMLGKKLNVDVLNLSNQNANFKQTLDMFENALRDKGARPTHVIHLIPGHFKVAIEADEDSILSYALLGNKRTRLVTPSILKHDTLWHNIKKYFVKPTGQYYLCEEYKKLVKDPTFFDHRVKEGILRNQKLQNEFGYKTFYILSEMATKFCMGDEIVLHDDLKRFGKKNFQTGTDCPVTQDYTNYMIDLVTPVLKDVNTA